MKTALKTVDEATFLQIIASLSRFRTKEGLFSVYSDGEEGLTTQNDALWSMQIFIALRETAPLTLKAAAALDRLRESLEIPMASLEKFAGVTSRKPGDSEHDSMDNATAHLFWSRYSCNMLALRIYKQGKNVRCTGNDEVQDKERARKYRPLAWLLGGFRTRYFWNADDPSKFCFMGWHGRSPGYMASLRMAAGVPVGFIGKFCLLAGQFFGLLGKKENVSPNLMAFTTWAWLRYESNFWRTFYGFWLYLINRRYGGGVAELYTRSFSSTTHPMHSLPRF